MRLCGISSRFQLLSPCIGQVTHALLTRPPLSHIHLPSEEFRRMCFVRLACVRHAASVHPEPGSNSQIKVFVQDQNQAWLNFYPVYLLLGCSLRTILFSNCSRICHCSVIKVLFAFLWFCFALLRQLLYFITSFCVCQALFSTFFETVFSEPVSSAGPPERGLCEV